VARPTLHVATICTGDTCRSPIAEVVLKHFVATDPLLKVHVVVTSAGTARWHFCSPMDPRARAALDRSGLMLPGTSATSASAAYSALQSQRSAPCSTFILLIAPGTHRVRQRPVA
jgi:protein-tyrosine phosphatase